MHHEFARDSNALNPKFYFELLHILGLKETNEKGKILIQLDQSQNTSFAKHLHDKIREKSPQSSESELFESTMSHIIIYLNRILFLKLIEANLLHFNDFDKNLRFLSADKILSFKTLRHLFFEVLAKDYENRKSDKGFDFLPYLNSSLFMRDEKEILDLSTFDDDLQILPFSTTQTEYKKDQKVAFLAYLFDFLECWDFGKSEDSASSDKLISSSVLGAMFEKLNGYKEGSFYTPNFITSFMCRESLSKVVCEKFNASFEWNTQDLDALRKNIDRDFDNVESRAKEILRSIRICDPSVGSGHFLISALSEMIYIYHKLGLLGFGYKDLKVIDDEVLLTTKNNENFAYKRFDDENHQIQIALFNLKKSIIENNLFGVDINPNSCNIARLRLWIELLKSAYYLEDGFNGKIHKLQTLPNIDINIKEGNSLISHFPTFEYDKNQKPERYTFAWLKNGENSQAFINNFKEKLLRYNHLVQTYKEKLGNKQEIEKEIKGLKAFFKDMLLKNSFTMESLEDALRAFVQTYGDECFDMETPFGMEMIKIIRDKNRHERGYKFQPTLDQLEPSHIDKKGQDLLNEIYKAYLEIENLKNQQTFEWRFEFPEVLDLETFEEKQARIEANNLAKQNHQSPQKIKDTFGDFLGFDLVIGNPPYIKEPDNKKLFDGTRHLRTYQGKMDIWYHFVGKGFDIVKNQGIVTFIATNNWTTNAGAKNLRNVILKESQILNLVDFGSYMCFDSASIQTMIMEFRKSDSIPKNYQINYARIDSKNPTDKHRDAILGDCHSSPSLEGEEYHRDIVYLNPTITPLKLLDKPLTFSDSKQEEVLEKIQKTGKIFLLEEEAQIGIGLTDKVKRKMGLKNYEVGTGIFQISHKELESLKLNRNELKLIKPLYTSNELFRFYGNPKNSEWVIYTDSSFKNPRSMDNYPNLKKHLDNFKEAITSDNKPYGLHRAKQEHFFNKTPSIVSLRKCPDRPSFTYVDFDCYVTSTFFVIKTDRINLKFLTGLFNSKLVAFWLKHKGKMQGNHYQVDKEPLLNIPIPKITKQNQNIVDKIIALVDKILKIKAKDSTTNPSELESDIDNLVYELYDLNNEEIMIVDT